MPVTILEALYNANHNLDQACASPIGVNTVLLTLAKEQLHNAVTLLQKGYGLNDVVERLLEPHDSVDEVPKRKEIIIRMDEGGMQVIGSDPLEGVGEVMSRFGHALDEALITAVHSYRFAGPVWVLLEEMHDPQAVMLTMPSAPEHRLEPRLRYMGQAEYVLPHIRPGEDATKFAPEFALDFRCMVAADAKLPRSPPIIEGGSRPLILRGEVLRRSFLGVRVPVAVTVRFDGYDVTRRRPGTWHVTVGLLPEETFTGRVTPGTWLASALRALMRKEDAE